MFEQALLAEGPAAKRAWNTFIGVTGQAVLVTCAVMAPLIWPEALPRTEAILTRLLPPVPPHPPPPGDPAPSQVRHAIAKPFLLDTQGRVAQPVATPTKIYQIVDEEPPSFSGPGVPGGVAGGLQNGLVGGILSDLLAAGNPRVLPAPVAPPKPAAVERPAALPLRVKQGGLVHPAVLIHRVGPTYPPLARQMRISGVVQLEGVIGVDGHMRELRLITGHPLLAAAALAAVRQWIYSPTTLNGDPVEVIAPITVTFTLN